MMSHPERWYLGLILPIPSSILSSEVSSLKNEVGSHYLLKHQMMKTNRPCSSCSNIQHFFYGGVRICNFICRPDSYRGDCTMFKMYLHAQLFIFISSSET